MRTTVDIDQDVLLAAKDLARRRKQTAGQVISDLVRHALQNPAPTNLVAKEKLATYRVHGFQPFASRGGLVSNELINQIREQDVE